MREDTLPSRRFILGLAVVTAIPVGVWLVQRRRQEQELALPPNVRAGHRLRDAIDVRYATLKREHSLKGIVGGGNRIDDVLEPFIKPGMRWTDAAAVLEAAGFSIGGFGEHITVRDGVYAEIDNYDPGLVSNTTVVVLMRQEKNDRSRVGSIEAGFVLLTL